MIVAPLPDINGHDMMPVPDSPQLILLVREQLPVDSWRVILMV